MNKTTRRTLKERIRRNHHHRFFPNKIRNMIKYQAKPLLRYWGYQDRTILIAGEKLK